MVFDLRVVTDAMVSIHPLVASPYILAQIPEDNEWLTILHLKDASFCIPVHPSLQYLFAFKWINPNSGQMQQHIWTILP